MFVAQSSVKLYVNRLNTEESIIPYEYHHFDFCVKDESNSPVENLGQVVFGERIRPSAYTIDFLVDQKCSIACTKEYKGGDAESERKLTDLRKGNNHTKSSHYHLLFKSLVNLA